MVIDTKQKKIVLVTINSREYELEKEEITFDEVVDLAFPNGSTADRQYRVSYRNARGNKKGTLAEGQSVELKDGMAFNVDFTNRS
jgi:hypothetical protein